MSELQQLHHSGILTGSLNCYCLPCDRFIENSRKAYNHIASTEHSGNLYKIPYLPRFEGHQIRKFKTGYFCEFCNDLIPTGVRVDLHVTKDEHNQNRGAHYLKSSRHGVSAFDNIHIDDCAWQGLLENLCCVCDIEIEDEATHKMDNGHLVNLIQKPIKFGKNDDIYRQINNLLIQCLTCNKLLPLNAMDEHFVTAEHVNLKSKCKVEANQNIKHTRKQHTNTIDSNYRTDTTAINDSRVKNTYDNSYNIEDLELTNSLLHAAIYHDFGLNDDIETDTDFKSSHDYIRKHNIEKCSSTVSSTSTDEQINFKSKYKLQDSHDNQDTFKQDTNRNNINEITTLNDFGNEHDNSSNIEEFEKYQTEVHAAIYRSLDIDDETVTLFGEESEIVINHDPNDIKKYENINQSTFTDVQYPAEQVDPNSKCKVEANFEIQNTLKEDTNSNNNDKIDATALNYSSSKYEQENSSNIEEFEIPKIMPHTVIRNSIDGNDETKTMFCKSSENVIQHDYNDFEKDEKNDPSTSSNVQYQAEHVDFNSKCKMEANHEIHGSLKQDSNSKNIAETNTTEPNNSGGKKEHDNSTIIDGFELSKILLHAAKYHGINLNDDIKTVFSKSPEIDIVPSTSTDEQVNFNSKNKMQVNHEIKDSLEQDTYSNNINKIDITTLYDSGNKYDYDNSSNVEEFEKYQSMIHKAINRGLDIDDETEALFERHSEIDIKHDHNDIKRYIDSINVQNPAENVDLNSKCQVESNLEVQDSYKKDINSDNNNEIDTIALNVSGYKIDNDNPSNVDELVISKTMLHAAINDETEIEFCRSSEIDIKHEHDDINEKHENIESSSTSTEVKCPVEHVDLNSKCKVEVNYEIQNSLKQDSNSLNVNETDITALSDSGNKIEHANSSNIKKLEMSKTMLDAAIYESININAQTETDFCKSSEVDVKRDYNEINKHIENHENIAQSTSTEIQYPAEHVDLYSKIMHDHDDIKRYIDSINVQNPAENVDLNSKCQVESNLEIQDSYKKDINSDNNEIDTIALNVSGYKIDNDDPSNVDELEISKSMLHTAINDETEIEFCRSSEIDIKHEHDDINEKHENIESSSTSTDVQCPVEHVDLNSKCKVEVNYEIQDTLKQDSNSKIFNETDTTALSDSGNKIEHANSSNIEKLEMSKTMLDAAIHESININAQTETDFCKSSEIDVKRDYNEINKHIENHENIAQSTSTEIQYPAEHVDLYSKIMHDHDDIKRYIDSINVQNPAENVDLNSKCQVESNLEVQDSYKKDINSDNNNEIDTIALNVSGYKIDNDNPSNVDELVISKTMLHAAINDETEIEFCRSSEIDIKHEHDDINEKHENIESSSTSTEIQYPAEHVDLYSKIKVAVNFDILGTLKQGTNSNDNIKKDSAALNDCNSDNEYLTTFGKFPISTIMLQALLYQCIDVNEETETVFCRVCKTDVSLERNDIMKHIEKHANIGQSTSTDVQYPENFKFDAKEWLDLKFDNNYYVDNNVKKDVTTNSITGESCLQIPKNSSKNRGANNKAHIYTNLRQFAKNNYLTYDIDGANCRVCKVRLPFAVKSMQEHVNCENHKRNVEAAKAANANTNGDTCLTKEPVINTVNSFLYVEQKYLVVGYLINNKQFISKDSFLLFAKHDEESLICMNCGSIFRKGPVLYLQEHTVMCSLPMNAILRLVTTEEEEFIREIKPEIYHCGTCHMVFLGWDEMQVHLRSSLHKTAKDQAHVRLMYVLSIIDTRPYPENFKVRDELEPLRDLCARYQPTF